MTRELQPCGTAAAFRRHQLHGEPPCQPCRQAFADYRRRLRERVPDRRPVGRPRSAVCGTTGGYRAHLRYGEVPCFACMDAVAAAERDYRARRRAQAGQGA